MRVGNMEVSMVSDGTMRVDGGTVYGVVPKVVWKELHPPDRRNRVTMGLNCLLIQTPGDRGGKKNTLVDTGIGNRHSGGMRNVYAIKGGRLVSELRALGLGANDIDTVVLTHLHFDHAGGCVRRGYNHRMIPTFPKATYLAQRQDWQEATHPSERTASSYMPDALLSLEEGGQLELLDGDTEIAPGIRLKVTGGHTPGHQMVFIESGDRPVAYLGDVLPTPHHLPQSCITSWDDQPQDTYEAKGRLLAQAEKEGWVLTFCHSPGTEAGFLVRRDGQLGLEFVSL
jgi:glyoxylase-like metal-dependent hydrolase (beta-lactamase superfamily II)